MATLATDGAGNSQGEHCPVGLPENIKLAACSFWGARLVHCTAQARIVTIRTVPMRSNWWTEEEAKNGQNGKLFLHFSQSLLSLETKSLKTQSLRIGCGGITALLAISLS